MTNTPGMMTAYTLKYWDTASGTIYCIHFRGGKVGVNYTGPLSGCQARYKMLNSNKRARRRLKASMILDKRIVDSQCENCERLAVVE